MKFIYLLLFSFITLSFHTQVLNDDCFNATPLGNLPVPANCGNGPNNNGEGAPVTFNNLTNVNSQTEAAAQQSEATSDRPTRAYVVSTDITSQQALDRDIESQGELG